MDSSDKRFDAVDKRFNRLILVFKRFRCISEFPLKIGKKYKLVKSKGIKDLPHTHPLQLLFSPVSITFPFSWGLSLLWRAGADRALRLLLAHAAGAGRMPEQRNAVE